MFVKSVIRTPFLLGKIFFEANILQVPKTWLFDRVGQRTCSNDIVLKSRNYSMTVLLLSIPISSSAWWAVTCLILIVQYTEGSRTNQLQWEYLSLQACGIEDPLTWDLKNLQILCLNLTVRKTTHYLWNSKTRQMKFVVTVTCGNVNITLVIYLTRCAVSFEIYAHISLIEL